MKVLVTGGAGFIGSHLVDALLAAGTRCACSTRSTRRCTAGCTGVSRAARRARRADVRDRRAVARASTASSGSSTRRPRSASASRCTRSSATSSVNTVGAAVLLEEASSTGATASRSWSSPRRCRSTARASTGDADGRRVSAAAAPGRPARAPRLGAPLPRLQRGSSARPTPETKPLAPTSIYAITSATTRRCSSPSGRAYGIPGLALRYFNVYGPRQALSNPYTGVAAIFSSRLLERPAAAHLRGRRGRAATSSTSRTSCGDPARALEPEPRTARRSTSAPGDRPPCCGGRAVLGASSSASTSRPRSARVPRRRHPPLLRRHHPRRELLGYEPRVSVRGRHARARRLARRDDGVDRVDEATSALEERGLTL